MRDLEFRGFGVRDSKWSYGGIFALDQDVCMCHYIVIDFETIPVINESVGQYTGIEDSMLSKIFEGDLVDGINPDNEDEVFIVDIHPVHGVCFSNDNDDCYVSYRDVVNNDIRVVGNIHQNPELLGGQNEQ